MIGLAELAALHERFADEIEAPVAPLRVGGREVDTDVEPVIMSVLNLSKDSAYRSSVSTSTASALRNGTVMAAQGAHWIDVGAEATQLHAERVDGASQSAAVVPVIEGLSAQGVVCSIEAYDPAVIEPALQAGAGVVNLSGSVADDEVFALAAQHDATVVMCHVYGATARDLDDVRVASDPIPQILEGLGPRVEAARAAGVRDVVVDPGIGFSFKDLTDPRERNLHQSRVLLHTFRLRALGAPVCQSLPHGLSFFESEFRTGEAFYAVLAALGRAGVYRTHEAARLVPVLNALRAITP